MYTYCMCRVIPPKSMYIKRGNGRGGLFFHVKLNLIVIDPCHTVRASTTVEGCQAGGLGHQFQYMPELDVESPKQGRKWFNYIAKI